MRSVHLMYVYGRPVRVAGAHRIDLFHLECSAAVGGGSGNGDFARSRRPVKTGAGSYALAITGWVRLMDIIKKVTVLGDV